MIKTQGSISLEEAKRIVLNAQNFPTGTNKLSPIEVTQSALEHMGYVQIDTISVIQRAHHHTLWNRNPAYQTNHIDELIDNKKAFEYWSHAAAYLPMNEYRYTLPRKSAIANNEVKHWYDKDEKLMTAVYKRIADEGPLMAKDFEHKGDNVSEWGIKPTKMALDHLFMQGDIMIAKRNKFHKVYDITERVLPSSANTNTPSEEEYARFLINKYLRCNGVGQTAEMTYLLKKVKPLITRTLKEMLSTKEIEKVSIENNDYYILPETLQNNADQAQNFSLKILSPFDNLLIQRKRMKDIFGFDYLLECYVTETKRQYGYFSLPILWKGEFVARMDCKVDRKTSILHIKHLALEQSLKEIEEFALELKQEVENFMKFNECTHMELHKISPKSYYSIFSSTLKR